MSRSLRIGARGLVERIVRRSREVLAAFSLDVASVVSLMIAFPITVRALGAEGYGEYTILYVISGIGGLWVYAGLSGALVQLILQLGRDTDALLHRARRQVLGSGALVSLIGIAIAVGMFGTSILWAAIGVLVVDFAVFSLANVNMACVYAVSGVVKSSRLWLVRPVMRAAGVLALGATGLLDIYTLIGVNVASSLLLLVWSQWVVRTQPPLEGHEDIEPTTREVVGYTAYYATSMSTNAVQNEGEKLVLAWTQPTADVGQYNAAYRVVSTLLLPLTSVVGAAGRWYMQRDDRANAQLSRTAYLSVATGIYGVVAAIAVFFGRDLIGWIAGSSFDEVSTIAAWLCLLPLLHGLGELPPMGLLGLGRNRERMYMGFVVSALALAAYLLLVPTFGWRGAVVGTYISEVAGIVVGWILLVRYQRVADRRPDSVASEA